MRKLTVGLMALALFCGAVAPQAASAKDKTANLIARNMKESGRLKGYKVGVKYEDGVAWLMGTVTSPQQKKIAEQLARGTEGVEAVVSRITIEEPARQLPEPKLASTEQSLDRMPEVQPMTARRTARGNMPLPYAPAGAPIQAATFAGGGGYAGAGMGPGMGPAPTAQIPPAVGQSVSYDNPQLPGYAWPSYAASPNYAALTYPKQYSPSAWPYIGPFYPYPQVPLGWRKVQLEWDDGWWFLDFKDNKHY
ncbi:MAG: BON domain-containing protein [Planctomycetota bacterium]